MSDKDIRLASAPDSGPDWPVWPGYTSLWDADKMNAYMAAADISEGRDKIIARLILQVQRDYDMALSKAQFELWQCRGMRGTP